MICSEGSLCFITRARYMKEEHLRKSSIRATARKRRPGKFRSHLFRTMRGPTGKRPRCRCGICCCRHRRRSIHHERRKSERPCRGRAKCKRMLPCCISIHAGEFRSCSWLAASRRLYSFSEGDCGEPISFHAANALLWLESARKCSSRARFAFAGKPVTSRSISASEKETSSSW